MIGGKDNPTYKMDKLKKLEPIIKRCRDFYLGSAQVKDLGDPSLYIARLPKESDKAYKGRVAVTSYLNQFAQAVDGLTGIIMLKEPDLDDYDGKLNNFDLNDVDMRGNSFYAFLTEVCTNAIMAGTDFVAIHTTNVNGKKRIYLKRYPIESLQGEQCSDKMDEFGNFMKQTKIFFKEIIEVPHGEFGTQLKQRFVVYTPFGGEVWLSGAKDDWVGTAGMENVTSSEVKKSSGDGWENEIEDILVTSLSVGREKSRYEVIPLFHDLADQAVSLLNLESWEFNKMMFMGNAFVAVSGASVVYNQDELPEDSRSLLIQGERGEPYGQCLDMPEGASIEVIEAEGKGLHHIQNKRAYSDKQADSSSYGLQSTESIGSNTRIESHENVVKLRAISKRIATKVENFATFVLNSVMRLNGEIPEEKMRVKLDKDFEERIIGKSNVEIIKALMDSGDLSLESGLKLLVDAGSLPSSFDVDAEVRKVNTGMMQSIDNNESPEKVVKNEKYTEEE